MSTLILILLQISLAVPNEAPKTLYTTAEQYYMTTGYRTNAPHKTAAYDDPWGDAFDDDPIADKPDGPMSNSSEEKLPVGDELWILLVWAAVYGVIKWIVRKIYLKSTII